MGPRGTPCDQPVASGVRKRGRDRCREREQTRERKLARVKRLFITNVKGTCFRMSKRTFQRDWVRGLLKMAAAVPKVEIVWKRWNKYSQKSLYSEFIYKCARALTVEINLEAMAQVRGRCSKAAAGVSVCVWACVGVCGRVSVCVCVWVCVGVCLRVCVLVCHIHQQRGQPVNACMHLSLHQCVSMCVGGADGRGWRGWVGRGTGEGGRGLCVCVCVCV
jgi:hypothetical protein